MPSLREILDKQKGQTNGQNIPVAQPITAAPVEVKTSNNVGQNGSGEVKEALSGNGPNGGQENSAVLPERLEPPAGLSPIALMKWKREHPGYAKEPTPSVAVNSNLQNIPKQIEKPVQPVKLETVSKPIGDKDAGKTNDGVIDTTQLKKNLEYLANNIDQKELVGQIIRTIGAQIKSNPALMGHFTDHHGDMDLIVRAMRRSYAIVARKKSEKREEKESKDAVLNDLKSAFNDAGLGSGFKLDLKL